LIEEVRNLANIDKVSISLHNTFDLTATLATVFDVSEGQVGFGGEESEEMMFNLFQFYTAQEESKFKTTAGDLLDFDSVDAGFIGVDEEFVNVIDNDLIIWSSEGSSTSYSFNQLFAHNNTCILAKSIANLIGINDVGQYIRLTFYDPKNENDPGNVTLFRVVGVSGGIPGYYNFRSNELAAYGGGVMVSLDNYMRLMKVNNLGEDNMIVDKAFVNLIDSSEEKLDETKDDIRLMYQEKDIIVDDAITKISFLNQMTERQSFLMEVILSFTIMISIFGLVSSMYAIMLERKFEIGILRSMGMKTRNVRNMFLLESMIILLSSGIMGVIIGTFTSFFLQLNMSIMTEMPMIFNIPVETLLRVFMISVSVGFLGTFVILIKLSRQTIMDTFRETF
jgi:ABC-type antimicrobial peptide transport system permease subunit